jgi:hypothetical protein
MYEKTGIKYDPADNSNFIHCFNTYGIGHCDYKLRHSNQSELTNSLYRHSKSYVIKMLYSSIYFPYHILEGDYSTRNAVFSIFPLELISEINFISRYRMNDYTLRNVFNYQTTFLSKPKYQIDNELFKVGDYPCLSIITLDYKDQCYQFINDRDKLKLYFDQILGLLQDLKLNIYVAKMICEYYVVDKLIC